MGYTIQKSNIDELCNRINQQAGLPIRYTYVPKYLKRPNFALRLFAVVHALQRIRNLKTTVYHLQTKGKVEIFHKQFLQISDTTWQSIQPAGTSMCIRIHTHTIRRFRDSRPRRHSAWYRHVSPPSHCKPRLRYTT